MPETPIKTATEADAVATIVRDHMTPTELALTRGDADSATVYALPSGIKLHSIKPLLDEYRTAPERRKGTATLTQLDSFVMHVKRFADEDSAIFASREPKSPSLMAVFDYHRQGADAEPRFGTHRAVYNFPISEEWKAWIAIDGDWMGQAEFAKFTEDRIGDVVDPSGALASAAEFTGRVNLEYATPSRVLELSRGLTVLVGQRVAKHVNLSTGEGQLSFEEEHRDSGGAPMRVPGAFLIAIPVFAHEAPYQIPVRLRYRVAAGSVSWALELYRATDVFDAAIAESAKVVAAGTGLPFFYGFPET